MANVGENREWPMWGRTGNGQWGEGEGGGENRDWPMETRKKSIA